MGISFRGMSTAAPTGHPPFRVGLIGFGLAGSVFHGPLVTSLADFTLDTVVTARPERQASAAASYPGVRVVASAEELWPRADELDLVVVASPNRAHAPLATAALRAGLPGVVDKPLTATASEASYLAGLAEELGLMLAVYQNRRWDGDFLTAADGSTAKVPTLPGDYQAFYGGVAAALQGEAPPPVTAWDATASVAVLEAARSSAKEGRAIELDLDQ